MTGFVTASQPEVVHKEILEDVQSDQQRLFALLFRFLFFCGFSVLRIFDGYIVLFGYKPDRIQKVQVFLLHDKGDAVTAPVAAEAVIQVLRKVDRKGRCSFRMKRTEPFERMATFSLELHIWLQYALNGQIPDFGKRVFTDHNMRSLSQQSKMDWPEYFRRW